MRLIDADALFEALGLDQYNNAEGMTSEEEWVAEAIMAAPTIEAEPVRRGRWVEEPGMFMCSVCYDPWSIDDEEMIKEFNYCPNCGAKMEEQE